MIAKTPTQRKAAERARKKAEGLEEVRGIYAPKSEHDKIRAMARMLTQRANM